MTAPDLSVLIPVYNRGELIRYTLESVRRASSELSVETLVIDDGSAKPVSEDLRALGYSFPRVLRQSNQGLLFARLAGLEQATGRYCVFLDSDDLVGREKFHRQIEALETTGADVSYTDTATCRLEGDFTSLTVEAQPASFQTDNAAEFYVRVQPPPHSPVFRTNYLRSVVKRAAFPPSALYNSVAEIWFYYNAAPLPGRVRYVPGPHTIIGIHPGVRLTNHWENLAVASLAVLEAFARSCTASTPEAIRARELTAEAAFRAWRALPDDMAAGYSDRLLGIWKKFGPGRPSEWGSQGFQNAAQILGPVTTDRLLRRIRPRPYEAVRTLGDTEFKQFLDRLPAP